MRAKTRHYNETTEFYVNELPRSCSEDDCPFNYDTNGCNIVNEDSISEEQNEELRDCLKAFDKEDKCYGRASCCPLRKIGKKEKNKK